MISSNNFSEYSIEKAIEDTHIYTALKSLADLKYYINYQLLESLSVGYGPKEGAEFVVPLSKDENYVII